MDANMVSNSLLCHDTREQLYQGNNNNVEDKPKICSNSEPEMFQSNGADDEDSDKTLNSLVLPTELEFRRSGVHVGEGVWTKVDIARGEKLGPLEGEMRNTVEGPTTSAWEMLDDTGRVIGWWDSSHSNHWMTYVRSTTKLSDYNVFAVQKENKVFYQSCRDLCAGEELLLCVGHELVQDKDISVHPEAQEVRSYPCQKCQQAFKSKVALRRHETYVCNNLQTVFRQHMDRRTLHNVLKQDRGESSVPRQEEASGETKSEITRVEPDIENIQDEEDIEVDVVDAADDILLPQAIQVSNKVFYCDNCPLVFRHPDELQGHIRSEHPGARSHPCPDCGKTFATSSGLKQHQHIHSSVKPFQCEVCFKAYTQFSNLCRHKRMHADCRQPVKCDMCQQTFSTLHSLSKHKPFCGQVSAPSKPKQEKGQGRSLPVTDEPVKRKEIIHDMPLIRPTDLGMKLLEPLRINTSLHYSIPGLNPYTNYFLTQGQQLLMNTQLPGMYPFGHKPVNTVQSDAVQEDASDLKSENNNNSPAEYNAAKSFKRDDRPTVNYRKDSTPESCAKLYEIHQEMPGKRYQVEQPIPLIKTSATASSIQMDSEDEPLDLSAKTTDCPVPRVTHVFGSRASYQSEYSSHNSQKSEISPNPDVKAESINNQRHHQAQGCTAETDSNGTAEHDSYFDDNSPNFNQSVMSDNSSRPKSLQDSALFVTNNEDQFTCHICAKGFPRSANLIRHLRTHTGEQPYRCSDCDRCFSISSNLKRHINAVHHSSFVTVSCSLCGVAFTQLKKLQSHVRREHTVKSSVNKGSEVPETSSSDSSEEGGFSVSTYNRKTQVEGTPLYSDGPSAFGPLSLYKASSDVTASAVGGNLKRKMEPTENLYHLHKIYKKQRVETVC